MAQIIGEFIDVFPPEHDSIELSFSPKSERTRHRCRHYQLSAHFLADYFINFLPLSKENPAEKARIKECQGSISYIANELLENAMKFNLNKAPKNVRLGIHFVENPNWTAVMFATNYVDASGLKKFQMFIQTLLSIDPDEFYMQQVEKSLQDENVEMSGLGFISMINDYQARLGWKFDEIQTHPSIISVTSMAKVSA